MADSDELVPTSVAAQLLGKTRMQVRFLIKSGLLSAERQGRFWMVRRRELERFLREKHPYAGDGR